jgi:hypothetical protein
MHKKLGFGILMGLGILVMTPVAIRAQSLTQTIEQLTLDYQKLAELKKMLAEMYTGYEQLKKGYDQIRDIAEGNFNVHKAFLDALLAVSPAVRDDQRIVNIINNEIELVKEYKAAGEYFSASGHFSSAELDYFNTMYGNLLNGSLRNLDELAMVVTPGELRMNDAERLAAIDRINLDMTDKLSFLRVFNNDAAIQAGQRAIDQNNISAMQGLYGLGN